MKEKNRTRYIVLLVILISFTLIMYFAFGKENIQKEKETVTIIVGDTAVWNYSDMHWLNVTSPATIEKLNWLDYNVFIDNKRLGNYYLWYNQDKWYIFDQNRKAIQRDGNIIAYRSNYEIKVKDFQMEEIRNQAPVRKVLSENNLSTSSKFTVSQETSIDIDNDGITEKFYLVSNAFPIDFEPSNIFTFVFMVKNNEIYPMYSSVEINQAVNGCKPYISAVLDIDNDNTSELVVSCGRYSTYKPIDMLYKFTDQGFKILISNQ